MSLEHYSLLKLSIFEMFQWKLLWCNAFSFSICKGDELKLYDHLANDINLSVWIYIFEKSHAVMAGNKIKFLTFWKIR